MGHTTKKQWEYAKQISERLNIDMPKTNDFDTVNKFIQDHRQQFYQAKNDDLSREINEKIAIVDYASMLGFTLKRTGSRYFSLKEHDSVIIDPAKNVFYRNSIGYNGKSAYGGDVIEFAKHFTGKSYATIMQEFQQMLGNRTLPERKTVAVSQKRGEKKLTLPAAAYDMRRVFAYLTKTRGLYQEVVQDFVDRKMLYQDESHGNCVFVSRDDDGTPVFACKRGTHSDPDKRFVGDVEGCNYEKGFFINNGADKLILAESVIDAMSVMSILYAKGIDFNDYNYLALAGAAKYSCIINQIKAHPVKDVYFAMDADKAGRANAEKAKELIEEELTSVEITFHNNFPQNEKDWNAELTNALKRGVSYRELDFFQTGNNSGNQRIKGRTAYAQSLDLDDDLEL